MLHHNTFVLIRFLRRKRLKRCFSADSKDGISRVFLFPGQGSQFVGMCQRFSEEPWLKSLFDRVSSCVGFDLLDLCFNGPEDELHKTENCQLAVVTASLAAVEWCRHHGDLDCDYADPRKSNILGTAGLSVGEFTALVFAKALSLEDAIKVIHCRAKAMQQASQENPSGMVTIKGLNESEVKEFFSLANQSVQSQGKMVLANHLYPKGHVIAGPLDGIEYVLQLGKSKLRVKNAVTKLPVSGAFHTLLMSSAQPLVKAALDDIDIKLPGIPVYSNVTGRPYDSIESIKKLLVKQIVKPVQWQILMQNIIKDANPGMVYELGPGKQLNYILYQIDSRYRRRCKNIQV